MSFTPRLPSSQSLPFLLLIWHVTTDPSVSTDGTDFLLVYLYAELEATWHIDYRPVQTVSVCELWAAAYGKKNDHEGLQIQLDRCMHSAVVRFSADVSTKSMTYWGFKSNLDRGLTKPIYLRLGVSRPGSHERAGEAQNERGRAEDVCSVCEWPEIKQLQASEKVECQKSSLAWWESTGQRGFQPRWPQQVPATVKKSQGCDGVKQYRPYQLFHTASTVLPPFSTFFL